MKPIDLKSVLIAAAVGAAIAWGYARTESTAGGADGLLEGAIIGAGVQIAVRLLGVS